MRFSLLEPPCIGDLFRNCVLHVFIEKLQQSALPTKAVNGHHMSHKFLSFQIIHGYLMEKAATNATNICFSSNTSTTTSCAENNNHAGTSKHFAVLLVYKKDEYDSQKENKLQMIFECLEKFEMSTSNNDAFEIWLKNSQRLHEKNFFMVITHSCSKQIISLVEGTVRQIVGIYIDCIGDERFEKQVEKRYKNKKNTKVRHCFKSLL